jgi:hypothetical protein
MKSLTALIAGLTVLGFFIPVLAAEKQESGSFDNAFVKRDTQPIAEGHVLQLAEATGINKSGGRFDGYNVSCREIDDVDQGNGPQSGYCLFTKGNEEQTVKFGGKIATELKEGRPYTTFGGNWTVVKATGALAGSKGKGTYSGYFTAEDKYHTDWKGSFSGPAAVAKR